LALSALRKWQLIVLLTVLLAHLLIILRGRLLARRNNLLVRRLLIFLRRTETALGQFIGGELTNTIV